MTGVGVLGTCQELNIPLIVHFHGYDAYLRRVLDRYEQAYKKNVCLFKRDHCRLKANDRSARQNRCSRERRSSTILME